MSIGIWLKREYLHGGIIEVMSACSNCNFESSLVMSNWKYCPRCGQRNAVTEKEWQQLRKEYKTNEHKSIE